MQQTEPQTVPHLGHKYESTARADNRGAVVAAEIGNRFEVGDEFVHQPHHF